MSTVTVEVACHNTKWCLVLGSDDVWIVMCGVTHLAFQRKTFSETESLCTLRWKVGRELFRALVLHQLITYFPVILDRCCGRCCKGIYLLSFSTACTQKPQQNVCWLKTGTISIPCLNRCCTECQVLVMQCLRDCAMGQRLSHLMANG